MNKKNITSKDLYNLLQYFYDIKIDIEVENANIEKHVQVILNNNTSDEYILDRAKSLIKKNNKRKNRCML